MKLPADHTLYRADGQVANERRLPFHYCETAFVRIGLQGDLIIWLDMLSAEALEVESCFHCVHKVYHTLCNYSCNNTTLEYEANCAETTS